MSTCKGLNRLEKIFYINLSHREDRNASIVSQLKKLGVKEEKIERIEAEHDVLNGHRGCALSHIKALKLAQEKGLREVLILEDDAFFLADNDEIEAHLGYFYDRIETYDIFFLGGRIKKSEPSSFAGISRVKSFRRAHAYLVQSHYIPKLLACFESCYQKLLYIPFAKDAPGEIVIDIAWDTLFENALAFFTKNLVFQRGGYSDIQHMRYDDIDELINE
jgi:GR25 family glycosyltransferase involved in LPS biosynthesis